MELEEIGWMKLDLYTEKKQVKTTLKPGQKKKRLQWVTKKHLWRVDDWMKIIFNDESRIYIDQGKDTGTFVYYRPDEIYKNECLKRTSKLIPLLIYDMELHVR